MICFSRNGGKKSHTSCTQIPCTHSRVVTTILSVKSFILKKQNKGFTMCNIGPSICSYRNYNILHQQLINSY